MMETEKLQTDAWNYQRANFRVLLFELLWITTYFPYSQRKIGDFLQWRAEEAWQWSLLLQKLLRHALYSEDINSYNSQVGTVNSTFEIPRGTSITSDNKPHKVTIAVLQLKANLSHYATPDTSAHVYLKGKGNHNINSFSHILSASAVNSTEKYPFLAGPMSIYFVHFRVLNRFDFSRYFYECQLYCQIRYEGRKPRWEVLCFLGCWPRSQNGREACTKIQREADWNYQQEQFREFPSFSGRAK